MGRGTNIRFMAVFWCNGEWIVAGDFSLPPTDRGVILGLALFETMLAVDGLPKFTEDHLARWKQSCDKLGWTFPDIDLAGIGSELLRKNRLVPGRGRIRLTMTAGTGSIFDKVAGNDAKIWITATPVDDPPKSIEVLVSPWKRNASSPLAGLKTASYAENILALDHARNAGFEETIFFNTDGKLCEAATSNVFLVRGDQVVTPSLESGCLPGVARSVVIRMIRSSGRECLETSLGEMDLENADEIFLTSAIRGPVPVSRLGDRKFHATPAADSIRARWIDEICRL